MQQRDESDKAETVHYYIHYSCLGLGAGPKWLGLFLFYRKALGSACVLLPVPLPSWISSACIPDKWSGQQVVKTVTFLLPGTSICFQKSIFVLPNGEGALETLQQIQRQRNLLMLRGSSCISVSAQWREREREIWSIGALSRSQWQKTSQAVLSYRLVQLKLVSPRDLGLRDNYTH